MLRKSLTTLSLLCALAMTLSGQARNVFVTPPGDGNLRPVTPFTADPLQQGLSISAAQDTFLALTTPTASKYYLIGRSATDTVVITDSNFNVIGRRSLNAGATSAVVTPDGRYLLVTTNQLVVISTSTDQVIQTIDVGGVPNDVAVSRDNTRAFVSSSSGSRVTAVDLNSFFIINSAQNLGPVSGVTVGPNGLVYASATNILYELDPRDLTLRNGQPISLNAQPGKPLVLSDTLGNLRVVMVNQNPQFGGSSLIYVDLGTRTVTPLIANNILLDRLVPVSPSRVLATSNSGQLYDINLPGSISPASFSGLAQTTGIRAVAVSNEFPNARYAYLVSSSTNTIVRIDLPSNAAGTPLGLTSPPGGVSYTAAAAIGVPASVVPFNNGQFINPGSSSLPIIIRALDATGRPVANVPVQFTTAGFGAFITSQSSQTDGEGYAQAVVTAPSTTGAFQVVANVGTGVVSQVTFNLVSGTGTGGATGAISVRSGNGQVIREAALTPEALKVIVRDTAGNPVPNVVVNWTSVTNNAPNGNLQATQTFTDSNGESTNFYAGPFLGPNLLQSYVQSVITASTFSGQATFYVTTIPNLFGQNPASFPTVQVIQPTNTDTITARAGTTVPGAIQVRVAAGAGPGAGQPIPNVGLNVTTGLDSTVAPTASCSSATGLTDSNGLATCDLIVGGKIGETALSITAGGQQAGVLILRITAGLPGKIVVIQGDNQTGAPGATLPLALLARVEDAFGNVLPNTDVTWTVESGAATLVQTINRGDTLGRVSTLVRLGAVAGPAKIRLTAQGGTSTATVVFTANVAVSATQLVRISGDGQSALVNTAFGEPLIAQVRDAAGAGVAGVQVTFRVSSGSVTLNPVTAVSDSSGNVRTSVTAGGTPGAATIAADFSGNVVSWTLTVRPIGPTLISVLNAGSGGREIAPGSIVTIRGTNIAATTTGYVVPPNPLAPLPSTLAGVSVTFGGTPAPIFWVANLGGEESVTVQVPFEVPDTGSIPVTVTSGGNSATTNVTISRVAPGILETVDGQGRRFAIITRLDGSYVTPDNPIGRGEMARAYVTGLGRTNTASFTNALGGVGQNVTSTVVVGINDAGAPTISAAYAQNLIGVYVVTFMVPADTTPGLARNFGLGIDAGGGNVVFGNGSTIAIR